MNNSIFPLSGILDSPSSLSELLVLKERVLQARDDSCTVICAGVKLKQWRRRPAAFDVAKMTMKLGHLKMCMRKALNSYRSQLFLWSPFCQLKLGFCSQIASWPSIFLAILFSLLALHHSLQTGSSQASISSISHQSTKDISLLDRNLHACM